MKNLEFIQPNQLLITALNPSKNFHENQTDQYFQEFESQIFPIRFEKKHVQFAS